MADKIFQDHSNANMYAHEEESLQSYPHNPRYFGGLSPGAVRLVHDLELDTAKLTKNPPQAQFARNSRGEGNYKIRAQDWLSQYREIESGDDVNNDHTVARGSDIRISNNYSFNSDSLDATPNESPKSFIPVNSEIHLVSNRPQTSHSKYSPKHRIESSFCVASERQIGDSRILANTLSAHLPHGHWHFLPNMNIMDIGGHLHKDGPKGLSSKRSTPRGSGSYIEPTQVNGEVLHPRDTDNESDLVVSNNNLGSARQPEDAENSSTQYPGQQKKYKCSYKDCVKAYSTNKSLRRHLNIHRIKPITCPVCGTGNWNRSDLLQQHLSQKHREVDRTSPEIMIAIRQLYENKNSMPRGWFGEGLNDRFWSQSIHRSPNEDALSGSLCNGADEDTQPCSHNNENNHADSSPSRNSETTDRRIFPDSGPPQEFGRIDKVTQGLDVDHCFND